VFRQPGQWNKGPAERNDELTNGTHLSRKGIEMKKITNDKIPKQIVKKCSLVIGLVTLTVILYITTATEQSAVEQTAEDSRDPSHFTYARLYCTSDGNSHWESVTVDLRKTDFAPPAAPIYIGDNFPASSAFLGGFEARWGAPDLETGLYHPAPAAQFIIVLQGVFSITATDGETRRFRPGDVFRLEDTSPCKGHITIVGNKPGFFMFVR
jgi:hypothetical protein